MLIFVTHLFFSLNLHSEHFSMLLHIFKYDFNDVFDQMDLLDLFVSLLLDVRLFPKIILICTLCVFLSFIQQIFIEFQLYFRPHA